MKTTSELLEESRALRNSVGTKPQTNLRWSYTFRQVLGPVGFSWADSIVDFYEYVPGPRVAEGITVIIHGHSRDKFCCASTLCHVLGWLPDENALTPVQRKEWAKFGYSK